MYDIANHGRRRHWTTGRMASHSAIESPALAMAMIAATSSPKALTHAVPEKAVTSTKMHHPRNKRCPVFSRTGAVGGAEAGCFE
ncbi:hypothetical protein GCM10009796_00280 [Microbacterium koreense]